MKTNTQTTVSKEELQEMAEILFKLQQLPQAERIAMQYYIKGAIQGVQMTVEPAIRPAGA